MASLFYLPKVASLPGSKLFFFISGTSTAQAVYTDADLQVAHSQPVEADANGVFAPIYLDPTLPDYRVTHQTSADVLIYTVDDVPSNQNVQQSMRLESTNPFLFLHDTDGTVGLRKYLIRANGATFEIAHVSENEAVVTPIIQFFGNVLYSNQTEVAVTSAGEFTGTLTGVDATITGTFDYKIVSGVVTISVDADVIGTSNTTAMTITGLPAAIRPSVAKGVACTEITNDTLTLHACRAVVTTGGTIAFYIARTDTTANFVRYSSTGFTNSGVKGVAGGWTITYPL
jgi:hypothetical protein